MKVILENLWQLQELDRKVIAIRAGASAVPDLKPKQVELRRIQLQEQEKRQGLDDLRLARNQTKAALDSCCERLTKANSAVKEIKSAEVLQATVKEIEQLKKFEEGLELKEKSIAKETETLSAQLVELEGRRVVLEGELESFSNLKKAKDQEIEAAVREIEAEKGPIQSQIQPKYLSLYQRIAGARSGIAVARVRGSSCGGCNMVLPAQFVNELPLSKGLEICPSCKRILVSLAIEPAAMSVGGSSR